LIDDDDDDDDDDNDGVTLQWSERLRVNLKHQVQHDYNVTARKTNSTSYAYGLTLAWNSIQAYVCTTAIYSLCFSLSLKKEKVKERIVLREIHLRTTGRHLSMGSHRVICHPTEVTAPPSPQPGRLVLDLSTP